MLFKSPGLSKKNCLVSAVFFFLVFVFYCVIFATVSVKKSCSERHLGIERFDSQEQNLLEII